MINDSLFLLSIDEVEKYLPNEKSRICLFEGVRYWWWLRSAGCITSIAANVSRNGLLLHDGFDVNHNNSAVRPALHINLSYLQSLERTKKGYIRFGSQKWLVLDEETGLLLSKDAVGLHRFGAISSNYERSEIREYLNDELLNEMFTKEEQNMIVDTIIDGERSYCNNQKRKETSKSVLVIDTQKKCSMCEFMKKTDEGYCFCGRLGFDYQVNEYPSTPKGKLDCCPLKEMPQKYANISTDYERGYNACIDEILEG